MGGAALSFLAPLALIGLIALPALWWLLRATPPQPATMLFPPLRLLARLANAQQTPQQTPWWLLALRLALAALVILAFAGPLWRASDPVALPGRADAPLLIILESDWSSAPTWPLRLAQARRIIETAGQEGRPVGLLAAPQPLMTAPLPGTGDDMLARLDGLEPQPVPLDPQVLRASVDALLASTAWRGAALVWLTGGLPADEATSLWRTALMQGHALSVVAGTPPDLALSLATGSDGPAVLLHGREGLDGLPVADARTLAAFDGAGRQLAREPLVDASGTLRPRIAFDLPLALRNDIARIAVLPTSHAGEVVLVDDRMERRRVGIVGAERRGEAQPLLSGTTYVERALAQRADVSVPRSGDTSGEIEAMIAGGTDVIILVDVASLVPSTVSLLEDWMSRGGVLIRFASTSLAQVGDALVPVPLRSVDRQLGGALTWEEPQAIAPFSAASPFAGLAIPQDVLIERQVLSEPGAGLGARTYAELADATPLVTGDARGEGHLVLFHVTADTDWSNLPLSGLFVDMLARLLELSALPAGASAGAPDMTGLSVTQTSLAPRATLDGFGRLGSPPLHAEGLLASVAQTGPTLANPPGFYGPAADPRALNLFAAPPTLQPADAASLIAAGAQNLEIAADASLSLRPLLLALAVMLAIADAAIVLVLSGALAALRPTGRSTAAAVALLALALAVPGGGLILPASAQTNAREQGGADGDLARLIAAANTTRLAYVLTGDGEVDRRAREGLSGLSRILTERTAFEPGAPMAIDPAVDELAFFPLIYWPMPQAPIAVSDQLVARIDAYMNNGGTILFDTRDEAASLTATSISPQTANLRALLGALDIPPLEPVPDDHVLTKSFYLLESFPGRFATGPLWVEALPDEAGQSSRPARGGDGVSPIMITGNDFASAWALSPEGRPLYATSPPDLLQREFAYRTGVNIGMYVMTGNYKADQVHIPALLERLSQ